MYSGFPTFFSHRGNLTQQICCFKVNRPPKKKKKKKKEKKKTKKNNNNKKRKNPNKTNKQ